MIQKSIQSAQTCFSSEIQHLYLTYWKLQILLKEHFAKLQKEKERFFVDFSTIFKYNEQKYIKRRLKMTKKQLITTAPDYIERVLGDFSDDDEIDIKDTLNTVAELMEA